jgi:hypothetical protein
MRFWEDVWFNKQSLAVTFPGLYDITFNRNITVEKVEILLLRRWFISRENSNF